MSSSNQISTRSLKNQKQRKTPPSFWDNLSRQVLVPRALNRRTTKYRPPIPPQSSSLRSGGNYRDLKRFARLGGPSLADLNGYHRAVTTSEDQNGSAGSGNMDSNVEPDNKDEITQRMAAQRPGLEESGLTMEKFQQFKSYNRTASKDDTIMSTMLPIITGNADAIDVTTVNSLSFGDLEDLTDGSLMEPVSSCCDGLHPLEIDAQIRQDLAHYIVPSRNIIAPCLPNFFIEGKIKVGPIARRQGCYSGTLGARGVYELRSYVDPDTALDNNAYTVVATYHSEGTLKLYTIHPIRFPDGGIAYYMTCLDAFFITNNLENFRRGVRALRNARDWAAEQRRKLANAANAKIRAL